MERKLTAIMFTDIVGYSKIMSTNEKVGLELLDSQSELVLPIIKNCKLAVCNDSSFSHFSASLGVPTIVLMCDTPLLYGNYSPKMHPILPDDIQYVSHGSNGKDKINPDKIVKKAAHLK